MNELLEYLSFVEDTRQQGKVKHLLQDIILLVLFASLANAEHWDEIEAFGTAYEAALKQYIPLKNGIPSHDTIQRVMAIVDPRVTAELQRKFSDLLNRDEGEKLRKIINIDGKTMKGNRSNEQSPLHIVSAYSKVDGVCFAQIPVEEKSNEITAIPKLLDGIQIKNHIVTIDAMGTQTEIVKKIRKKQGHYVLAVKKNQQALHEEISLYLENPQFQEKIKADGNYHRTVESARSQIETREYYQTDDIHWMEEKKRWTGLKSIGMVKTTIEKGDTVKTDTRYYISDLEVNTEEFSKAVRGHWAIESMHWHLDVTFREDANHTLDKTAAQNMNNLRKLALAILKLLEMGKYTSLRKKRYMLSLDFPKYLSVLFEV